MSLISNNKEYLKLLDCIVEPKLQTDATAQKLHALAIKTILPASKPAHLQELSQTLQTFQVIQGQFPEKSKGRALLDEAVAQLEKRTDQLLDARADEVSTYVDNYITELYRKYDAATNGRFSPLLKIYSYIDMRANKADILEAIDPTKEIGPQLDACVKAHYFSEYEWLKANIGALVTPYNHGNEDFSQGLSCHQNCSERQALLLKNPATATKDISLGSTAKSRSVRAKLNFMDPSTPTNKSDIAKTYASLYAPFGMKLDRIESLKTADDLPQLLEKHSQPFMLRFEREGVGHTINVQCDPKNKIYRFVDDNIGSFSYASKEELSKQLTFFLKTFYSGWDGYRARFTTLIK